MKADVPERLFIRVRNSQPSKQFQFI